MIFLMMCVLVALCTYTSNKWRREDPQVHSKTARYALIVSHLLKFFSSRKHCDSPFLSQSQLKKPWSTLKVMSYVWIRDLKYTSIYLTPVHLFLLILSLLSRRLSQLSWWSFHSYSYALPSSSANPSIWPSRRSPSLLRKMTHHLLHHITLDSSASSLASHMWFSHVLYSSLCMTTSHLFPLISTISCPLPPPHPIPHPVLTPSLFLPHLNS